MTLCGTITQLVSENDRRLPRSESEDDDDGDEEEGETPEKKEEVQRLALSNLLPGQLAFLTA